MFTIVTSFLRTTIESYRETSLVVLKGRLFRPPVHILDGAFITLFVFHPPLATQTLTSDQPALKRDVKRVQLARKRPRANGNGQYVDLCWM